MSGAQTMSESGSPARRVLFVENGIGYGGAAICLRHLARNLDRTRYESLIVTGRTGPEYEDIANDAPWLHIRDRYVDVFAMRERIERSQGLGRLPLLKTILLQLVARVDDIANFTPFFFKLLWRARRFRPDLIHANNEPLCNRAALLVGKTLKIPTVCHVRGTPDGSRMMPWAYRLVDHFIPVSHWISRGMQDLGLPQSKRTVIYDGIALDALDPNADPSAFRDAFDVPAEAFAVGLVGLLIPWKGQELFLDAAKQLRGEIPNLRMLIIGGTPDEYVGFERMLRQRVQDEGLADTVFFTGHVSDMPTVYAGLDVAVSASTSPEPLGTMVIETMAMGRPLVAPNHGGAAEMAEHDKNALLFEPGNPDSLAEMIRRLHVEPGLGKRLGDAAREKALRTFDVQTHVAEVEKVYDLLLK